MGTARRPHHLALSVITTFEGPPPLPHDLLSVPAVREGEGVGIGELFSRGDLDSSFKK